MKWLVDVDKHTLTEGNGRTLRLWVFFLIYSRMVVLLEKSTSLSTHGAEMQNNSQMVLFNQYSAALPTRVHELHTLNENPGQDLKALWSD